MRRKVKPATLVRAVEAFVVAVKNGTAEQATADEVARARAEWLARKQEKGEKR